MSVYICNDSFLMHHGIQGQKWGVRRYQNEDGSLTDAGRKRYNQDNFKEYKREVKRGRTGNTNALNRFYESEANRNLKTRAAKQLEKQTQIEDDISKYEREREIAELKPGGSTNTKEYKSANAKLQKAYKKFDKIYDDSANLVDEAWAAAESFSKDFLGSYGSKKINGFNVPGASKRAADLLMKEIHDSIVYQPYGDRQLYKR